MPSRKPPKEANRYDKIFKENLEELILPILRRYFSQLNILSRLRNLNQEIIKNISAMPITIDIEKDYLYQKGLEQGLEQGLEKGIRQGLSEGDVKGRAQKTYEATVKMLRKQLDVTTICEVLEVTEAYVLDIKKNLDL